MTVTTYLNDRQIDIKRNLDWSMANWIVGQTCNTFEGEGYTFNYNLSTETEAVLERGYDTISISIEKD